MKYLVNKLFQLNMTLNHQNQKTYILPPRISRETLQNKEDSGGAMCGPYGVVAHPSL
jgi:hypothetical protein